MCDSFIRVTRLAYIFRHGVFICRCCIATGWQRCIQCLKLQVIFRERATSSRLFSEKEPLILGLFLPVSFICRCCIATGWQRCIGYLKLQVSFRKRAANSRALLTCLIHLQVLHSYNKCVFLRAKADVKVKILKTSFATKIDYIK